MSSTKKDAAQIIKAVYDETNNVIRTSSSGGSGGSGLTNTELRATPVNVIVTSTPPTNIIIDASDDSIAIADRTTGAFQKINNDGSIDANIKGVTLVSGRIPVDIGASTVNITGPVTVSNEVEIKNDVGNPIPVSATDLDIRNLTFAQDKVDASGSVVKSFKENIKNYYSEITSVASGVSSVILTKVVTVPSRLLFAEFSGSNIAEYVITLNGTTLDKKRTQFGASLNDQFSYPSGISLVPTDSVVVSVLHSRPYAGDFNAKLNIEE